MDGRFRLALVVRDGDGVGERNIESESCADLAGAAAVALGLLLNSDSPIDEAAASSQATTSSSGSTGSGSGESTSSGSNAPTSEPSRPPDEGSKAADGNQRKASSEGSETRDSSRPEQSPRSFLVALRAPLITLDVGPFPAPSLGFGGALGLQYDAWRFFLSARVSLRQRIWAEDFPGHGADVGRAVAALSVCRAWRAQPFEVAPCVNLAVQRVWAEGFGDLLTASESHVFGFGGGVGAVATWRATPWLGLLLSAAATIEASRPRIVIEGLGELYQLTPATLSLGAGAEWLFL